MREALTVRAIEAIWRWNGVREEVRYISRLANNLLRGYGVSPAALEYAAYAAWVYPTLAAVHFALAALDAKETGKPVDMSVIPLDRNRDEPCDLIDFTPFDWYTQARAEAAEYPKYHHTFNEWWGGGEQGQAECLIAQLSYYLECYDPSCWVALDRLVRELNSWTEIAGGAEFVCATQPVECSYKWLHRDEDGVFYGDCYSGRPSGWEKVTLECVVRPRNPLDLTDQTMAGLIPPPSKDGKAKECVVEGSPDPQQMEISLRSYVLKMEFAEWNGLEYEFEAQLRSLVLEEAYFEAVERHALPVRPRPGNKLNTGTRSLGGGERQERYLVMGEEVKQFGVMMRQMKAQLPILLAKTKKERALLEKTLKDYAQSCSVIDIERQQEYVALRYNYLEWRQMHPEITWIKSGMSELAVDAPVKPAVFAILGESRAVEGKSDSPGPNGAVGKQRASEPEGRNKPINLSSTYHSSTTTSSDGASSDYAAESIDSRASDFFSKWTMSLSKEERERMLVADDMADRALERLSRDLPEPGTVEFYEAARDELVYMQAEQGDTQGTRGEVAGDSLQEFSWNLNLRQRIALLDEAIQKMSKARATGRKEGSTQADVVAMAVLHSMQQRREKVLAAAERLAETYPSAFCSWLASVKEHLLLSGAKRARIAGKAFDPYGSMEDIHLAFYVHWTAHVRAQIKPIQSPGLTNPVMNVTLSGTGDKLVASSMTGDQHLVIQRGDPVPEIPNDVKSAIPKKPQLEHKPKPPKPGPKGVRVEGAGASAMSEVRGPVCVSVGNHQMQGPLLGLQPRTVMPGHSLIRVVTPVREHAIDEYFPWFTEGCTPEAVLHVGPMSVPIKLYPHLGVAEWKDFLILDALAEVPVQVLQIYQSPQPVQRPPTKGDYVTARVLDLSDLRVKESDGHVVENSMQAADEFTHNASIVFGDSSSAGACGSMVYSRKQVKDPLRLAGVHYKAWPDQKVNTCVPIPSGTAPLHAGLKKN